MKINCTIKDCRTYLEVIAEGKGDVLADVKEYIDTVGTALRAGGHRLVFCDETRLTHELTGVDTYALGKFVSAYAADTERVAIVCMEAELPKERFYELVSHNRGLVMRVFTDSAEALEWLLGTRR